MERSVNLVLRRKQWRKASMQTNAFLTAPSDRSADEFTLEPGRNGSPATLQFKGRPVAAVDGDRVEAQFRFADHNALVLVSNNTPHQEVLSVILVGPNLRQRDRVLVGGAYAQGFLAYAERQGENEVAFCWHDLDLIVSVGRYWSWMSLRRRWLKLRDTVPQREPGTRGPLRKK
ncbi:hypothetical protein [Acidisphaera sp. L21]|uniref:hypothetical protein n=1 Tax=Acidisphaera sp. L21 TaxID=1641851 RepID=UPI00131CFDBC|nr:hypothetical protein [Acidisphaera sp. L21]